MISIFHDHVTSQDFAKDPNMAQDLVSSPEHEVLMMNYCGQSLSVVRRAASAIALKAYSSYTSGPIDSILGRKHRDDL